METNKHGLPVLQRHTRPLGQLSAAMYARQGKLDETGAHFDKVIEIQQMRDAEKRSRAMARAEKQFNNQESSPIQGGRTN